MVLFKFSQRSWVRQGGTVVAVCFAAALWHPVGLRLREMICAILICSAGAARICLRLGRVGSTNPARRSLLNNCSRWDSDMLCRSLMALSLTAPVCVHRQIYHGGYCKSPFGSQSHGVVACVGAFFISRELSNI